MIGERIGWPEPGPARWAAESVAAGAVGAIGMAGVEMVRGGGDIQPSAIAFGALGAVGLALSARTLVETYRNLVETRFTRQFLEESIAQADRPDLP